MTRLALLIASSRKAKKMLLLLLWLGCFVFNRGYYIGGFTLEYPDQQHVGFATMFSMAGPFALPVAIMYASTGAPYMWNGYSCQQRWEEFKRDGNSLDKRYFVHWGGNYGCREEELR